MLQHHKRQPTVCNPNAHRSVKPKVILTAAQKAQIVRLKRKGVRSAVIVAEVGCSEQAIQRVWTAYRKANPGQPKVPTTYYRNEPTKTAA